MSFFGFFVSAGTLALTACGPATTPQEVHLEPTVKTSAAANGTAGQVETGNDWFQSTEMDLGTYFDNDRAVGLFKFSNPTEQTQVFKNLVGSCTCSKAIIRIGDGEGGREYVLISKPDPNQLFLVDKRLGGEKLEKVERVDIGPGDEGEIEVHMEMSETVGVRRASLDVYTSDPELPLIRLKWHATRAAMFVVNPREVNLNKIRWDEKREFQVRVTSPLATDFQIIGHDPWPDDFEVEYEKEMVGDTAAWVIRGTYGPLDSGTGLGGILIFRTDLKGGSTFKVTVLARVEGPVEVRPGGFLILGMIRKGTAKEERIALEAIDDFDLQPTGVKLENLTVDPSTVRISTSKEGKLLHVDLQILTGIESGTLVRGGIVIGLNHPVVKEKVVQFHGFVR